MRRLGFTIGSLLLLSCSGDPGTPVGPVRADVVTQPTGTYDIYVYDVKSGSTAQATAIFGALEFNPAFSPNGKSLVHDVLTEDPFTHNLYVTDIESRVSTPLVGGEGGNDGDWSPNGLLIAFDRAPMGDLSVYVIPASGGERTLVRTNAVEPHWGADNNHLVFVEITDNSVRTIDVRTGSEHLITPFGSNPAWSKDGGRIAYSDGSSIFFVPVNPSGAAIGAPVQLTFDGPSVFNGQPSWSNNGKSIVFSSNRGSTLSDWDLWVVSVPPGEPTRLTGAVGTGDYDPTYYNKTFVAYAAFTPAGP